MQLKWQYVLVWTGFICSGSAQGTELYLSSAHNQVIVYDIDKNEVKTTIKNIGGSTHAIAFNDTQSKAFIAGSHYLYIVDTSTKQVTNQIALPISRERRGISISPQQTQTLAIIDSYRNQLTYVDSRQEALIENVRLIGRPTRVAYSEDGAQLAVSFSDNNVVTHPRNNMAPMMGVHGYQGLAWIDNCRVLSSTTYEVYETNICTPNLKKVFQISATSLIVDLYTVDEMVYLASLDGIITAFDLDTGIESFRISTGVNESFALAYEDQTHTLYAVGDDKLRVIEADTGLVTQTLSFVNGLLTGVAVLNH
ncbi:hypothetical protein [Vibrio sp. F13]|uniref:YncE family protein n=1 Tax=Vibrio sp. F13 TaxID=2070777 RepID=UPI0010BDD10E|nr:hypothetical protein [Vibrio sp. F13]TKG06071.1 hypothetical protein FCV67_15945 [Vibrio sp. F13]